jgi:adenylate kinase family enzyme
MFESLSQRTVIIGNSGAGKSALAESLADLILVPVIDLDLLNWEGDDYGRKRDEVDARRMTRQEATYAPQQKTPLFDHVISSREQRG